MQYGWITLLASLDYIEPVLVLAHSLRTVHSQYPLVVMVIENIYDQAYKFLTAESNIISKKINGLQYNKSTIQQQPYNYLACIASKFCCFQFKEYDKLIYIDADAIVLQNMDELFNYPDTAMYYEEGMKGGFAGLYVFIPENHDLTIYQTLLEHTNLWESDILERTWVACMSNLEYRIPFEYFVNITITDLDNIIDINKIKCLHFCYLDKPWRFMTALEYLDALQTRLPKIQPSIIRQLIIQYYFQEYLIPLRRKYGESLLGYSISN